MSAWWQAAGMLAALVLPAIPVLVYHWGWSRGFERAKGTYQPYLDAAYARERELARRNVLSEEITQKLRLPS